MNTLLHIDNLSVAINEQPLLKHVSLSVGSGTTHAIMGPNGSGKSSLAATLIGHPSYTITGGSIQLAGTDITHYAADKRARSGLFLAFQQPCEIPGVTVSTFLRSAYQACSGHTVSAKDFLALLEPYCALLQIDAMFLGRALNDGFSGGEKKTFELLQLLVLKPKVAILDEIDSGLDVDAIKRVGFCIAHARKENPQLAVIVITHYQRILEYVNPDHVHVLRNGSLVATGDFDIVHAIEQQGYDAYTAQP